MEILIIKSQDGWPIVSKGEIYEVIRKTKNHYICEYNGHEKHIPRKLAIMFKKYQQLEMSFPVTLEDF